MAWANTALAVEMALAWDTRQKCADGDSGKCWLLVVIDGSKRNMQWQIAVNQVCSELKYALPLFSDLSSLFLFS